MLLRRLLLPVLVLFVCATFAQADDPFRKPEQAKPAVPAKAAKTAAKPKVHQEAPRPKPVATIRVMQAVPPEAVRRALEQPADVEFIETPLYDVVQYLSNTYKIPILLDRRALDDVGVQNDTPVTISLKGLKLRSVLKHLLRPLDLTWMVQDEVLLVTTTEQADAYLETRLYEIGDLVAMRDEQLRPYNDFDQLIDVITSTVQPTTWDTVGGPGSIAGFESAGITVLVVSQTQQAHEKVEDLLAALRKIRRAGDAAPPVRKREPVPPAASSGMPTFGVPTGQPQPQPPAKN